MRNRLWLGAALGAVVLAAGLALWPVLATLAPRQLLVPGLAGAAGVLVAVTGLWPRALAWGLGLVAVEYVAGLELTGAPPDLAAPLYGLAWFLCAELGWVALEARNGERLWAGRALATCGVALAGAGIGWGLLLLALLPLPGGPLLTALGVAAAAAVATVLMALARAARQA